MFSASADAVPRGARERILAPLLRLGLKLALKPRLSPDVPIAAQRRRVQQLARLTRARIGVEIAPATVGGVAGEWLRPPDAIANTAILYLHGGAYCVGSAATHRAVTTRLAHVARTPVFAADYRLAPEYRYPAAREDAASVCRALAEQGAVAIAGDSAGAGLALATALALPGQVAALVLFSPWIDLAQNYGQESAGETMLSARWLKACAAHYLDGAEVASPRDADLAGLPPVLIQAGTDELLHDDAVRLHDALERAGVKVRCEIIPKRWHAFHLHAGWLPSADAAIARAAAFMAQHLA